jgi:hypothetical protein
MPVSSKKQFRLMKAAERGKVKLPGLSKKEAAEMTEGQSGKAYDKLPESRNEDGGVKMFKKLKKRFGNEYRDGGKYGGANEIRRKKLKEMEEARKDVRENEDERFRGLRESGSEFERTMPGLSKDIEEHNRRMREKKEKKKKKSFFDFD